jgi:hypothetical protein
VGVRGFEATGKETGPSLTGLCPDAKCVQICASLASLTGVSISK